MTTKQDILNLHKKQLEFEIDIIRKVTTHSAVKGAEAESSFKQLLRKHLPQKYKISSGFVLNGNDISNQHDIVICDDLINAPMYLGNASGLFLGGAVYGVLETTIQKLNKEKLEKDIKKLSNLRKLFPQNQVAFKKVVSRPILDEKKLKEGVNECLGSGTCIEGVWSTIKKNCISKEGTFSNLEAIDNFHCDKYAVSDIVNNLSKESKKYIVQEEIIYSMPPPRTYICALDGTSYKSAKSLAKVTKSLTKKYEAHIHGLLVLNKNKNDWFISTKAYQNYEVQITTTNAFRLLLESMKSNFQGMLVGKFPAINIA